ncbi:MAG: A/G-specific adenine glycosylase [Candidatus Brocadia sp.]|nr:MAG: A/G-specific adenine glycosylase [Candidatus Brocadia sp.]
MKSKSTRDTGKDKKKGCASKPAYPRKRLTQATVRKFQEKIYQHYRIHGRELPWRMTHDPYHILVSEIMLQQTQVQRVMGKYEPFLSAFPNFSSLARASLRRVFREWQGLGYNRRAIALKQIAQRITEEFHGNLPSSVEVLMTFPGIGGATAASISAFAFHKPTVFIETNIRRVFIHSFFPGRTNIRDTEILPLVEQTLDTSHPREWYYALMDYGVMLKQRQVNPNRRSAHYQKQSPFQGSNRQVRGMILRACASESYLSEQEIAQRLQISMEKIKTNLVQLEKEGFIKRKRKKITLAF